MWGATVIAGVFWVRYAAPEQHRPRLARLMASEPAHIVAHSVLYGALTAMAYFATRRAWLAFAVVAAVALLQESAQSVWWGRAFGPSEYFDFGVDAIAAVGAWLAMRWLARGAARRT